MKIFLMRIFFVALLLILYAAYCGAASTASQGALLCAITETVECNAVGNCTSLSANDVGLPDFLLIDLAAGKVREATTVSLRETSFKVNPAVDGMTILSGVDGRRGWSAVLSDENTRLTASISDEEVGFVVFANCRPEDQN